MSSIGLFAYKGTAPAQRDFLYTKLLDNPPRVMSVDIETVSLKDRRIIGVGFGLSPTEALYVPRHSEEFYTAITMLCDPGITKIYHNVLFDLPQLYDLCPEIDSENTLCTMLMCVMEGLPVDLAGIAFHLGRNIKRIADILPKGMTMDQLEDSVVADKCLDDCMATMLVYESVYPHINQEYFSREMALVPVLMKMSRRGIKIDQQRREELEERLKTEVDFYLSLAEAEGFNPASTQQVAYVLMQKGCRVPVEWRNGKFSASTDEEVLRRIDNPWAALVLNYRKVSKMLGTYIKPYKGLARGYTRFHMNAATGRISSTQRNMQNIPPEASNPDPVNNPGPRTMFLPDSGVWTDFDNSQQELRTLAYRSQDPELLHVYEKELDVHQYFANFAGIPRKVCKNVNFAAIYGASDETINETAGFNNMRRAHEIGVMWRTLFKRAAVWIDETQEQGIADGFVTTIGGRRLWLPGEDVERESDRRRKAVNYSIQGSAAELVKAQMLLCAGRGYDLALQVHDELVIDGHIEEEELRGLGLENVGPFKCPIDVKYVERWE